MEFSWPSSPLVSWNNCPLPLVIRACRRRPCGLKYFILRLYLRIGESPYDHIFSIPFFRDLPNFAFETGPLLFRLMMSLSHLFMADRRMLKLPATSFLLMIDSVMSLVLCSRAKTTYVYRLAETQTTMLVTDASSSRISALLLFLAPVYPGQ